jgi:hypothetical protein
MNCHADAVIQLSAACTYTLDIRCETRSPTQTNNCFPCSFTQEKSWGDNVCASPAKMEELLAATERIKAALRDRAPPPA